MKSFKDLKEEILLEGGQMYPADEMTMKELKIACYAANNILDRLEDGAMIQRWQISAIVKASEELASVYTSMSADMGDYDYEDEVVAYEYPWMGEEVELEEASNKLVARYMNKSGSNVLYLEIYEKPNGNYTYTISNQRGINVSASAIDLRSSHADAKKNVERVTRFYDQDGDSGALKFLNGLLPGWKKAQLNEEQDYKVSVEGLPDMYVKANSPSEVKANLRKIVRKPDMVKSVDRVTQSVLKKIFRDKATGKEDLEEKYKDPWAAPRKGSSAWHAAQQRKKAERDPEEVKRVNAIGNKNHMVGTAKVTHNEEVDLDEAIEFRHDRYMRSHGKKASGGSGHWMFTHKNMGDVDYNNEKEVHVANGKFADAKKSAQQWAKKHGHDTVYVMEEVEQLDELSPKTLSSYMKKSAAQLDKVERDWEDKSVSDKKVANRLSGFDRASKRLKSEEVEQIDEISDAKKKEYIRAVADKGGIFRKPRPASLKGIEKKQSDALVKAFKGGSMQDYGKLHDKSEKRAGIALKALNTLKKEEANINESEDSRKSVIGDAIKRYADDAGNAKEIRGVSVDKIIDAFASKKVYGNKSIDELESELGLPVGIVMKLIAKVKENLKLNYNVKASSGPTQAQRIGSYLKQKHIGLIKR